MRRKRFCESIEQGEDMVFIEAVKFSCPQYTEDPHLPSDLIMSAHCSAKWRILWQEIWHHLLPNACALCGDRSTDILCCCCAQDYLHNHRHRCLQCAQPLLDKMATHCGECLSHPPDFETTLTVADYAAPLARLILDLKFHAQLPQAAACAQWLAAKHVRQCEQDPGFTPPDLLIPIPLSPQRLRERGFNQSWEIARRLAKILAIPAHPHLLISKHHRVHQAALTLAKRHAAIRGAFQCQDKLSGLHIGVVDDVMTSGATLREAARILRQSGATQITNYVVLRTAKS